MSLCLVCRSDDPNAPAKTAQYRCPKCECPYCSLACYKAHGEMCTRKFEGDNIEAQMRSLSVDDDQKNSMQLILQRDAEEMAEEREQMIEDKSVERLEGLLDVLNKAEEEGNQNGEKADAFALNVTLSVWNSLTPEEQKEFEMLVTKGAVGLSEGQEGRTIAQEILDQQMNPWWRAPSLVVDLDSPPDFSSLPQTIPDDVPHVQSLLGSKTPSDLLPIHLVDLLFSYVCCFRVFGGSLTDPLLTDEIKQLVTSISAVLNARNRSATLNAQLVPRDLKTIVETMIHRCRFALRLAASDPFPSELLQDLIDLLGHKNNVSVALYHLHRLFSGREGEKTSSDPKRKRAELMIAKKLFFFVSWTNSPAPPDHQEASAFASESMFQDLISQISDLLSVFRAKLKHKQPPSSSSSKPTNETDWRSIAKPSSSSSKAPSKVLIEEL